MRITLLPRLILLLLALLLTPAITHAAVYTVGSCSGKTHDTLALAWNTAGTTSGPHTIRLCPGTHIAPALAQSWGHDGITLTSLSGNAAGTTLTASSGTLFGLSYHAYNISRLTVNASFSSQSPAVFRNSIINGTITTSGVLTIEHSSVNGALNAANGVNASNINLSGNISANNGAITLSQSTVNGNLTGRNGVTVTGTDLSGNITATHGPIGLNQSTVNGHIDTGGRNQPINLTGVSMTGGSITTGANNITLTNSSLGSASSRVPVVAGNEVKAYNTTVWGDISAAKWSTNTIYLDEPSIVYGYCDPGYYGRGKCQAGDGGGDGDGDDGSTGGNCDVQLQLSVPSPIAGAPTPAHLQANILEGEDGCFDGEQELVFYSERINPATPAPGEPRAVRIDNTVIATASPGTAMTVRFNDGIATLPLVYPDAGHLRLHACQESTCSYADFIARPAGFALNVPANPGAVATDGPVFTSAGTPFQILVTAIGANGERLPNFGREQNPAGVQLDTALLAPVVGVNPGLSGSFRAFGYDCNGNSAVWGTACGLFYWPEVGALAITPRIAGSFYLDSSGPNIVGPASVAVGRFVPHHFSLSNTVIEHRSALACNPAADFTYLGERFSAHFQLQARALGDSLTRNYTGAFARLSDTGLNLAAVHAGEDLTNHLSQHAADISWQLGTGYITLTLQLARTTGSADAIPAGPWHNLQLGLRAEDADGVKLKDTELVLDVSADGNHDHGLLGEVDLRFGRLLVDNALGSELGPLRLPVSAQYWSGSTWANNRSDSCTRLSLNHQVQLNGSLSGSDTVPVGSGNSHITSGDVQLNEGRGFIGFSAPAAPGYVDLELLLDTGHPDHRFLQDDLDADGNYDQNPRGRASWGLYPGNNSTILMLEAQP